MKKQRKKSPSKAKSQTPANPPKKKTMTRRELISYAQMGGLGALVLGGGGFLFARSVSAAACEQDLGKIGKGTPTIVQIHDPNCSLCMGLQKETRKALKNFEDDELTYLVANIQTPIGRDFANSHGVPHVTLMLFDGAGKVQQILNGPNTQENLTRVFRQHLSAQGQS